MSLDVYLEGPDESEECACDCGHVHTRLVRRTYFDANITHNLGRMAREAGIYEALWRPDEMLAPDIAAVLHDAEEIDYHSEHAKSLRAQLPTPTAADLIEPLRNGLRLLRANPTYYRQWEPENGWGTYDGFVPWVERYLAACEEHPTATVRVSR